LAASLGGEGLSLIAEIKRRSPSKGPLAPMLDAAALARTYEGAGAAALSVLTDGEFFGGSLEDLVQARQAVALPVLRKDFTVGEADVCDARIAGADAVLLIVAALEDAELVRLHALALELGLEALVEVHDVEEVRRALDAGAQIVGANQRDLVSFEVDPRRAERVRAAIPRGILCVAESGVRDGEDARRLAEAGFDAILVGEHLVTAEDPGAAAAAMVGHRVSLLGEGAR
jgi:indole-3-glycerol phosphate synthase